MKAIEQPLGHRCEDAPSQALLSLSEHAYAMYQLLMEDDVASTVEQGSHAADWLILAAGLVNVNIVTNGLHEDDAYCSNIYEETRGPAASAVATEMTRLLFVWGAAEVLMRPALRGSGDRESPPRRMSRLVDSADPLRHHDCAARNLLKCLAHHESDEFARTRDQVDRFDSGIVGQATLAACKVRNSLAHGAVSWPDNDSQPAVPTVRVAEYACRLMLFAVQQLMLRLVPPDAETTDWPADSDGPRMTPVGAVLRLAHLRLIERR